MKAKLLIIVLLACLSLSACAPSQNVSQIAATTAPVYEFTCAITEGTGLRITRLVTENVSCLHDYSLNVRQVKAAKAAEVIVLSGMGMEDFMEDVLADAPYVIDSSEGIDCLHHHGHEDHGHAHEDDPHIWLSPSNAMAMAANICAGLSAQYPQYAEIFQVNLTDLLEQLRILEQYGKDTLQDLSTRELITFHDGFAYFADSFDLTILEAVEEESGSEASAAELVSLIKLVQQHKLTALFTEANGTPSAPGIIARETGATIYTLDMAMSQRGYFEAMYHNINTIKEALG
jgi:ABC-type Zn uptake system ZnuABC Zn-binding protein ZnuA